MIGYKNWKKKKKNHKMWTRNCLHNQSNRLSLYLVGSGSNVASPYLTRGGGKYIYLPYLYEISLIISTNILYNHDQDSRTAFIWRN